VQPRIPPRRRRHHRRRELRLLHDAHGDVPPAQHVVHVLLEPRRIPELDREPSIVRQRSDERLHGNSEAIEVWRPGDGRALLVDDLLTWHPTGSGEPFTLDVKGFFADQRDDAPFA